MIHPENFRDRAQSVRQSARAHLLDIRRARLAKRVNRAEKQSTVLQDDFPFPQPVDTPVIATIVPHEEVDIPEVLPSESTAPYDNLDQVALTNLMVEEAIVPQNSAQLAAQRPDADFARVSTPAEKQVATPRTPMPDPLATAEDAEDKAVRIAAMADLTGTHDAVEITAASPQFVSITVAQSASVGESLPAEAAGPLPADQEATIVPPVSEADIEPDTPTVRPDTTSSTAETDLNSLPGAGPGLVWMLRQCGVYNLQDLACTEASVLVPKLGLVGQILNIETWLDFAKAHRAVL